MIKTVKLKANTEVSVKELGGGRCRIQNRTAGTLYVSGSPNITPCADGVMSIPAGRGDYFSYSMKSDTIYLLSVSGGGVELSGEDYYRPFDNAAVTGGVAVGNPVVMDGLQGGVPFSEIVVSGKNLIPSDYMAKSGTYNGVTVTVKNDGRFDVNGTPTKSFTILSFAPSNYFLEGGKKYTFNCNHGYDVNTFNIFVRVYNKNGVQIQGISTYPTTITANDGDYFSWVLWAVENYEISATDVEVQLELGDTPTAYEPPIIGRELTIHACGKNLIKYPYADSTKTINGVTFTDNGDGTITVNGTAENNIDFPVGINFKLIKGNYVLSGCPSNGSNSSYKLQAYGDTLFNSGAGILDVGNGAPFVADNDFSIVRLQIRIVKGTVCDNLIFKPQLELGSTATAYEPYHGAEYTITPDSNPYSVPDDIRQQDGLNNISVSEGELSVVGARKNAALKKVWDKLDELTTAVIVSTADLSE